MIKKIDFSKDREITEIDILIERIYRRGYHQGYCAGMDAFHGTKDQNLNRRVFDFFNDSITPWRYKDHKGKIEIPPTFKG